MKYWIYIIPIDTISVTWEPCMLGYIHEKVLLNMYKDWVLKPDKEIKTLWLYNVHLMSCIHTILL